MCSDLRKQQGSVRINFEIIDIDKHNIYFYSYILKYHENVSDTLRVSVIKIDEPGYLALFHEL